MGIFNTLLGRWPTKRLETDRVHRTPGFRGPGNSQPRDVFYRLHYFAQKEILRKAAAKDCIDFDGPLLTLFLDLSRRTLLKQRSLRPLTKALRDASIIYRWLLLFTHSSKEGWAYPYSKIPAGYPWICRSYGGSSHRIGSLAGSSPCCILISPNLELLAPGDTQTLLNTWNTLTFWFEVPISRSFVFFGHGSY